MVNGLGRVKEFNESDYHPLDLSHKYKFEANNKVQKVFDKYQMTKERLEAQRNNPVLFTFLKEEHLRKNPPKNRDIFDSASHMDESIEVSFSSLRFY